MYLFFDKNGTLLEIVNDSALRQYNQDANKMYVYIQDEDGSISGKIDPDIVGLTHRYLKANRKIVDNCPQIDRPRDGTKYKDGVFEYKEVPFNRKRDLKHFSYGRKYEFFVVDVPSGKLTPVDYEEDGAETVEFVTEGTVFDVAGTVLATLTAVYKESSNLVLERFAFTVEESVPTTDGALTGSQFTWLIGELIRLNSRVEGHYDYDKQNNRPIINVDMDSPDFIAKASNYYRHIGENSAEHRNGLIYYCPEDGTLVEIDGGTSLNLNGQYTEEATVYAPTNGGDNTGVKVLVPHGDGEEPTWERLSVSSSGSLTSAGVTYSIELGGNSAGTITLPKETYIEDITFNGSTKIVTFKYNGESGRGEKTVDLSKLVDVYTAGNGLQKSGNEFSIKTNSSYLSTSSQGLSVNAASIAGLAQIYLNGSRKAANSNQFYAPTKYHTSNSNSSCWVLVPNGINTAPIWERIYVEKSGLTYTLKLGNYMIGKIELTQEIYLDDVKYNSDTNKLVFTYNTASGQSAIEVDLTDLVDMYNAGLGLEKVGNKFNVKIAPNSEKYLKATAEGLMFDESALPIGGGGGTATGNGGTFIAKTEDEMTALLKPENVGALVSYMGEGGGAATVNPTKEGDTVTEVFFDTTKSTEEVLDMLNSLDWDNPDYYNEDEGKKYITLFGKAKTEFVDGVSSNESSSAGIYLCVDVERTEWDEDGTKVVMTSISAPFGDGILFFHANIGEPNEWELDHYGWQTTSPLTSIDTFTIGYVGHTDIWGSWLSAHENGFASGSASAYKKDSVYLVTEFKPKHSDIKAGDTIDTLYFNTDVTPDFSGIEWDKDGMAWFMLLENNALGVTDMSQQGGAGYTIMWGDSTFLYASEELTSAFMEEWWGEAITIPQGWNAGLKANGGVLNFDAPDTVSEIVSQNLWSSFISKEPFATEITTKKIDCESNLIVAKSETEFNNALVVDNIGKVISYNDELFVIADNKKPEEDNNVTVGDTIDTLYFNTSVEPDLSAFDYGESGLIALVAGNNDFSLQVGDMSIASGGQMTGHYMFSSVDNTIFYADFDAPEMGIPLGWNTTIVQNNGEWSFGYTTTIAEINQDTLWSSYIGKEPFSSGAAAGTPLAVGDTISSLYFDISKELDPTIFTYDEDSGNNVRIGFDGGSYYCLDIAKVRASNSPTGQDEYQMYLGEGEVIVWVSFDFAEYGIHKGWQQPIIDAGGKVEFAEAGVISNIPQQSAWDTFVSKEPFGASTGDGGIIAKPACPAPEPELPVVTASDSGKFLRVDANGKWVAQSIPYAEEASF